jgi:hypothetical protein
MKKLIVGLLKKIVIKISKNDFINLEDENIILQMLGIDKFDKILLISLNKKKLIEKYIFENQYNLLAVYDPSLKDLESKDNIKLNPFIPAYNKNLTKYYAKKRFDENATFFKKDLRWMAYNDDKDFNLEKSDENPLVETYDLLFLALNGYELLYLKDIDNIKEKVKIVKFEYTKFNVDAKSFLKNYFMFFYEQDFICFELLNNKLIHIKEYNYTFENDFKKVYYFINKKYLTKINYLTYSEYRLESYVDKSIN